LVLPLGFIQGPVGGGEVHAAPETLVAPHRLALKSMKFSRSHLVRQKPTAGWRIVSQDLKLPMIAQNEGRGIGARFMVLEFDDELSALGAHFHWLGKFRTPFLSTLFLKE
jgi:hypothetical protein